MGFMMIAGLLLAFAYGERLRRVFQRRADWRGANALLAIGLLVAAGFVALRGETWPAAGLAVVAAGLTASARWPRRAAGPSRSSPPPASDSGMSRRQAGEILGVADDAPESEIRAAYARLMQRVHPDKGGAPGLAAQLNLARDRLLKP